MSRLVKIVLWVIGVISVSACNNSRVEQKPQTQRLALGFSDVLPEIKSRLVYGANNDFWFELPSGWRVVPVPERIFKKLKESGKEEMLLRPLLSVDAVPYIRIARLFGLRMKPHLFIGDEKGAAKHILDQFFGGKWQKEILGNPVLDLQRKRFFFNCRMEPAPEQKLQVAVFFHKRFTLIVIGAFSQNGRNFNPKAFERIVSTMHLKD